MEAECSVSQEIPSEMERGYSVFLQEEEDDDKDNVLLAAEQIAGEQTIIAELTNIFKTKPKESSDLTTEPSNDDIGIVGMGGAFYCSGCDFVDALRKAAEKHLGSAHSAGKDAITDLNKTRRERGALLKCQLCKGKYPQVAKTIIHRFFRVYFRHSGSRWLQGTHGKEPQDGGELPSFKSESSLSFNNQVEGWQCDLCGFTTAQREKLSNHLSSQHARYDVQKTKIKTQVLKDVEKTCRITKMTSILKQPTKANKELIVVAKQEKADDDNSICSTQVSPRSTEQPIQTRQGQNSTVKTISPQLVNVKAFKNVTTSENQELEKKKKDKCANATRTARPAVMDLGRATNDRLARLSATETATVAAILAKTNVSPVLAKTNVAPILAKSNVASTLANRFEPIISFAGSLFTADASPEIIDTVMVNDQENYEITRSQDRMKIEAKSLTTNGNKQDMFWCGICGNMYKREETLMMHVKTHQLPMS